MCFVWIWEKKKSYYFTVQHWLVGFYNWDGVCLLRGTLYILRSAHTVHLCVLCGSENKQQLFHCTALTGWFLGAVKKIRKATTTFVIPACPSVSPHKITPVPPDGFSWNFVWEYFSKNLSRKYKFSLKSGNLHVDQYKYKFLTISCSVFLRMRNVSDSFVYKY